MILNTSRFFSSFLYFTLCTLFPLIFSTTQAQSKNDTLKAFEYVKKGDSLKRERKYEKAFFFYKRAIPVYENVNAWERVAYCFNEISFGQRKLGNNQLAFKNANKALGICENLIKKDTRQKADSYEKIGLFYELEKYDYKKAIDFYQKSLIVREKIFHRNHPKIADSYSNLGIVLRKSGLFQKALDIFFKALKIRIAAYGENHTDVAYSHINIGSTYWGIKNCKEAKVHYFKSLRIRKTLYGEDNIQTSYSYASIGNIFLEENSFEKALLYFKKSLVIREKIQHKGIDANLPIIYNNIALIYTNLKEYDIAISYLEASIKLQKNKYSKNTYYYNIANIYKYKKEYKKALLYHQKSLNLRQTPYKKADSYFSIGNLYREMKKYKKSLFSHHKALHIYDSLLGKNNFDVSNTYSEIAKTYFLRKEHQKAISYGDSAYVAGLPSKITNRDSLFNPTLFIRQELLLEILLNKAKSYKELYLQTNSLKDLKHSINEYRNAHETIVYTRNHLNNHYDKLTFTQTTKEVYIGLIEALLLSFDKTQELEDLSEIFFYTEQSKSNILKGLLKDSNAKQFGNIPENVLELERELKINKAHNQSQLNKEKIKSAIDPEKISYHESRLFDIERQQDSILKILERRYPKYHKLKYQESTITLTEVQNNLDEHTTMLEYFVKDSTIFVVVLSKNDFHIKKIEIKEIAEKIKLFKNTITSKDNNLYKIVGNELYEKLIAPIEKYLKGNRLIIVPDEELWQLNFDLLLTQKPISNNPKKYPYLLKKYAISYANSASLLIQQFQKETDKTSEIKQECLAFSYSDGVPSSEENTVMELAVLRSINTDLPGTRKEIKAIADIIEGKYYYGSEALERNFKEQAGKYNILHLALHGEIDNKNPENSRLFFTKGKDTLEDHSLYAHELFALNIPAELAVLSACNTGSGKIAKGEGIMSLGNAFQYAGTKSLLLTSWEVSDATTPNLMENFYKNLKNGMSKDVSLQQAKLKYLENANINRLDPFYWGGFYILGDTTPINLISKNNQWYWLLILIPLVVFLFIYIKNRI